MSRDVPLTVLDRQFNEMVRNTPSGMAYWAGSGPEGKTCRECRNLGKAQYSTSGMLKATKCDKYTELSYREGKAIPYDSRACKYFIQSENPPSIMATKRIA
jgi:hypothetical protein